MNTRLPIAVVLLLGLSAQAAAQEPAAPSLRSALVPGGRVRVTTTTMSIPSRGLTMKDDNRGIRRVGIVDRVSADVLIMLDKEPVHIPFASIAAVDISVGSKRNWLWGLGVGLGIGLAGGLAAPVDSGNCAASSDSFCSRGEAIGATTLVGGSLGAALGALIKTDRWLRQFTVATPATRK